MKQLFLLALALMVPALLEFGCKGKDGAAGPTGPAGPSFTGTMAGNVVLYNEDHSLVADKRGVTVSVEGTSISGQTDSTGKFVLNGVPTGIYNIVGSKGGYGTSKIVAVQFIGSGTSSVGRLYLDQMPGYNVATLTAVPAGADITVSGTINNTALYYRYVLLCLGKTNTTSSDPASYSYFTVLYVSPSVSTFSTTISGQYELNPAGFSSGTTIYIAAYSTGGNYASEYLDLNSGNYSWTAIGTIRTANVVMP